MSLAAESPLNSSGSSGSDDFAAFLDAELEAASSDTNPDDDGKEDEANDDKEDEANDDEEDDEADDDENDWERDSPVYRSKRLKLEGSEGREDLHESLMSQDIHKGTPITEKNNDICPPHPGLIRGMCILCAQKVDDDGSAIAFNYIHKDLKLGTTEINRLRGADLKNLLREKKLILILDLDHTLLNSTRLVDVTKEEEYLLKQADPMQDHQDISNRSLFKLERMHMLTKLRPFIRTFLEEASRIFEMYIYTMGERAYALEMANLLDPQNIYFNSKVISQSESTQRHQKGLDVILGAETAVLILDDTESVWHRHKENLILMERYHYFTSSCRQFNFNAKSLSASMKDERESDGALANILNVLKRTHEMFFNPDLDTDLSSRDVRQVLKKIRHVILQGCKLAFTRVFRTDAVAEDQPIWKIAEKLGATCSKEVDSSITHVISTDTGTQKARWALQNEKFLVNPGWIEAANYLWSRQREEDFPVNSERITEVEVCS